MAAVQSLTAACPCGGGAYADCCGPYLSGQRWPATPEALMRSRYTAFVRGDEAWLRKTWHPSAIPAGFALDESQQPVWLGLSIKAVTQESPEWARVEFVARYRIAGRGHRQHERSRFVCDGGRWLYVDGDQLD